MAREIKKTRRLSEISSLAELREARRELALREWYARERLTRDVRDTFSFDNLLSIVAPRGSFLERAIGSVGSGFTVAQGVVRAIRSLIGGEGAVSRKPSRKTRTHCSGDTPGHTTSHHATRPAKEQQAKPSPAKPRTAPARKKDSEIVVEVELAPDRKTPKRQPSRTKKS
jgi:hypothetical protein